jgi:hypothetical protein
MVGDDHLCKKAGTTITRAEIVCVSVLARKQLPTTVWKEDGSRRMFWIFLFPLFGTNWMVLKKSAYFVKHSCSSLSLFLRGSYHMTSN